MNYEAIYYLKGINRLSSIEISQLLSLFPRENDMILFAAIEENLKYESEETRGYLQSLQYYVGDKWIFPHSKPAFLESKKILWYRTIATESIQRALGLDNFFRSIVLKAGDSVENSKYVFYVIETVDSQVLCIAVKSKEDFHTHILPEIVKFNPAIRILNQL
ncbi:hypothetical protein B1A99_31575 [Cohnella sp. CIP 111063]|uniref:hypothetical protein n=1 Tax=unclassified Cohnella TaxID=2636738 RepID=UPI000B8C2844|nr:MULTISPECIES: hypothetical protein [unclassified Cohnella]OXS53098.1 hypothetical protein B1A99_31575 [Cohnella sp. CIP 111063]PRX60609.1 hypothetical protein B0G52_128111 [Cohnella sp. SGD-V74]